MKPDVRKTLKKICCVVILGNDWDYFQTRIYARPQQIANGNGDYAKDITPVIIDYFENYFNVSYPLPKSGMVMLRNNSFVNYCKLIH